MLPFRKKTEENLDSDIDITDDVNESDFIPYACHFDANTLLTKNGELLQAIKITANAHGIDYEAPELGAAYLRDVLRQAITGTVDTPDFAYWFHTVRRVEKIDLHPTFIEEFPRDVHDSWQKKNKWRFRYHNEVYVTVLTKGQDAQMFDKHNVRKNAFAHMNRKFRETYLDERAEDLHRKADKILSAVQSGFAARRLTIADRPMCAPPETPADGRSYSEPLELFSLLVNMTQIPFVMDTADLSKQTSRHEITFGYNAVESRSLEGNRRFGGLVTLKSFPEMSAETLDRFLQLPLEMVISQSFNYISRQAVTNAFEHRAEMLHVSRSQDIRQAAMLPDTGFADRWSPAAFGEEQTSILAIVDEYKALDGAVSDVLGACGDIGLVAVREDIKLEECFWAQLPGNFEFLRRKHIINAARMGSIARLNRFPTGNATGNPWGEAVTVLRTFLKTPYFFNFHYGANGHTAVIDYNTFIDTVGTALINFLVTQARQYGGRLVYFSDSDATKPLIQMLRGHYVCAGGGREQLALNPFLLEDNPRSRSFLLAWLVSLAEGTEEEAETLRAAFKEVLDAMFSATGGERSLRHFVAHLGKSPHAGLASRLSAWHGAGAHAGYFDHAEDDLDFAKPITGCDLGRVLGDKALAVPVFSYLLHRLISSLDGSPTVIVLNEAWALLDNAFFLPRLQSLLEMLTQSNALVIFTTRHIGDYADRPITSELMRLTATHLYIPDDVPRDYYCEPLQLSEHDRVSLLRMERQKGQFMIKRPGEVITSEFNLDDADIKAILSGDLKSFVTGGGKWHLDPQGTG